jgi:hypothetical protein
MSDDGKVIDIYEWHRPRKPGEFMGCALYPTNTPPQPEASERPRKMKLSELALAVVSIVLVSLLIASFI